MFARFKRYLLEANIANLQKKENLSDSQAQMLENMTEYRKILNKEARR